MTVSRFRPLFLAVIVVFSASTVAAEQEIDANDHCTVLHKALKARGLIEENHTSTISVVSLALDNCNAALSGDPVAQNLLSSTFSEIGLREESLHWLFKAVQQGEPAAMTRLANIYSYGLAGLEKNPEESLRLLRAAIDAGHAPAMTLYSEHLRLGFPGLERDRDKAEELRHRAAELGDGHAAGLIGRFMLHKNPQAGLEWVKRGADRGHAPTQYAYASYFRGPGHHGLAPDSTTYMHYLTAAAANGYNEAQFSLGYEYINGEHVPADATLARFWLSQAAAKGHQRAQDTLENQRNWQTAQQRKRDEMVGTAVIALGLVGLFKVLNNPSPQSGAPYTGPACGMLEVEVARDVCVPWE